MTSYTPRKLKPESASYPVNTLEIVETFTRETYEKRFAEQAAPFDSTKPDKTWFDTTEAAGNYSRIDYDAAGKPVVIPYTMTRELARSINLPGAYRWPKYAPAPTAATQEFVMSDGGKVVMPYPAGLLSSQEDARALALALGGTFDVDPVSIQAPFNVHYNGDPRKVYRVLVGNETYNAGEMLTQQYVNGIGAPGAWNRDATHWYWAPAPQITAQLDPRVKPIPVPCRPLDPDEEFRPGFGGVWTIWKQDATASPQDEMLRLLRLLLTAFRISY